MTIRAFIKFLLSLFFTGLLITALSANASQRGEIDYDIHVKIDPIARTLEGRSIITVKGTPESQLVLGRRFEVIGASIEGQPLEAIDDPSGRHHAWHVPFSMGVGYSIAIQWRGELSPLDTSLDHQQTLGRPISVSGAEGTFLPKSSGWYPSMIGSLARYQVNIELPPGQRGLVAGKLVEETDSAQGYQAQFNFPFPSEGIDLMAGPYHVKTDVMLGANGKPIQLRTYFHPEIEQLAEGYLDSVKDYIEFYESWIGSYPFTEFSVVSSPTPTGFGMPTLTYLGIDVLRLPFIRATSLGHEVLHNWWGNGVYPDYRKGNWSEGLTTFMADYAYKERESDEVAQEMRLGWLRDFAALAPGQDAALNSFTSRTHGASKIVGYNKAAMLFFMLRDELGEEMFNRGIQAFWTMQRFKITSWQDIQNIFELVSTKDLKPFFNQWLNQAGAPLIQIVDAKQVKTDTGFQLTITLEQAAPAYKLSVPIVVHSKDGDETHVFDLNATQQTFALDLQNQPLEVMLDPGLRLFRQLAADEVPPILREVMVNEATVTVLLPEEGEVREVAETLATRLQRRQLKLTPASSGLPVAPVLVIGLQLEIDAWLEARGLPARPEIVASKGSAQAWTMSSPNGATLAIVSAEDVNALQAMIRPLPHYGRQSFIVFDGARAIDRGAWPMRVQRVGVE